MILVTGAGGTVGREVVKALGARKAAFRTSYSTAAKAEQARASGQDAILLDFARAESIVPALSGIDRLFLLTAPVPGLDELERNLVSGAKRAGVGHIVKLSVWDAPSESFSFARSHRIVERKIEASGIPFTFLRPNSFMQNFVNHYAHSIRAQGAFALAVGEARISHIDVRDIAAVAAKILAEGGHTGEAYDLSGPAALLYTEAARALSDATGQAIVYKDLPEEAWKAGALQAGMPASLVDALIELFRYDRTGKAARVTPHVRDILGRDATPFDRFARDHASVFRAD